MKSLILKIVLLVFGIIASNSFLAAQCPPDDGDAIPTSYDYYVYLPEAPDTITTINWLTWEEALERSKTEPRKIFVDIYTDWCGWCKKMDKNTFQQAYIAKYVNENFYAVKFNAEQETEIEFKDKVYKFVDQAPRGYHELAFAITQGQLSYPTIVFLDEQLEVIQSIPGYRSPEEFEMIMTYFGKNKYKDTPWTIYQKMYEPMTRE